MLAAEVKNKLNDVMPICKKHKVEKLYVFGSAASGKLNKKSDIDLLITFKKNVTVKDYAKNFFELQDELEKIFSRRVDLTEEVALSNRFFIEVVNETKVKIYEA